MSGLHYDSLADCPEGLRRLIQAQTGAAAGPENPSKSRAKYGTPEELEAYKVPLGRNGVLLLFD